MTLKLYIQPKAVIFAARVNEASAVEYPRDFVTFDGVTTGTYSIVNLNQTVLIGSSAGAADLGLSRVRKFPTSGVLYIGRSSKGGRLGEVTLTDNAYISVLNEIPRVLSKVPYIDTDGITFVDSDLDYATYGASSPPVANAGSAVAGTIDSGTSLLTVNFSASNSFVTMPGAAIASYTWNVGSGGTITVGTSADEDITATFSAGFHVVTLLVADDNAASHRCYVGVLAIDPASDPTISAFEIQSHRITQTGQELQVRIREAIDEATYLDGTYAMIIDGEPADADDRSNIVFQGWIEVSDEEIRGTATGLLRDVALTLTDVAGRLQTLPGYSQVVEHAASPTTWQEMATPDMGRMIHFLLQWQCTALDVADFTFAGDEDDYPFMILASDGASIWDQVARRAASIIPDHMLTCDRFGALAIGIDPQLQDTGDRTATVQATLDADDYTQLAYRQQRNPRYSWLRSNAILAATDAVDAVFCIAPGTAPGQGEATLTDGENLALTQDALNATTGHRYARLNAPQSVFSIALAAGDDLALEPAALTWLRLTIDSAVAAQRGLTFTNARFLMQQIDIRYTHADTGLVKSVTIRAEREVSDGVPATTEVVPVVVPIDDGGWVPAEEDGPQFNGGLTGSGTLAAIDQNGNIYTTTDFTAGTPTWSRNTSARTAVSIGTRDLMSFVVDPFSPGYLGTGTAINGWVHDEFSVYRVTDLFGTPAYSAQLTYSEHVNRLNGEYAVIAASFGRFQSTETDNPWLMSVRAHNGPGGGDMHGVYVAYSVDAGQNWSSEIQVTAFNNTNTYVSPLRISGVYLSPRTPGYALIGVYTSDADPASTDIYKTTDWGATWASSGIANATADGLGYCFHVPWQDNSDESLLYYGQYVKNSNAFLWALRRTDGTTDTDIAPTASSKDYGPFRQLFGIQSLDTDRLQMVMAAETNEVGNEDMDRTGTDAYSAVFTSADGGDTWTLRDGPDAGGASVQWPAQVAFASGDSDIIYCWGNYGYLQYSTDNGANWADKHPANGGEGWSATAEIMGIAGGPTA